VTWLKENFHLFKIVNQEVVFSSRISKVAKRLGAMMIQVKSKLKLTHFLELIPCSLLRTSVLGQLEAGLSIHPVDTNFREATARLVLDIVLSVYDVDSSDKSNIHRISINLDAVASHLEHLSKQVERLEPIK
jgi:hypothetical protein